MKPCESGCEWSKSGGTTPDLLRPPRQTQFVSLSSLVGARAPSPSVCCVCGRGGGVGMTPWCDDLVCSWRRLLADRHSLPFPWTLSLHRRWCPSASHHPLTFLFLPALTFPLPSPFPSLGLSLRRPQYPSASPHSFPSHSLGRLCQGGGGCHITEHTSMVSAVSAQADSQVMPRLVAGCVFAVTTPVYHNCGSPPLVPVASLAFHGKSTKYTWVV